jgi:hypothetical protein
VIFETTFLIDLERELLGEAGAAHRHYRRVVPGIEVVAYPD